MIYLASQSPRRRQLLEQIGVEYETLKVEVDESWDGKEPADRHVLRLALAKARAGWNQVQTCAPAPVLGGHGSGSERQHSGQGGHGGSSARNAASIVRTHSSGSLRRGAD